MPRCQWALLRIRSAHTPLLYRGCRCLDLRDLPAEVPRAHLWLYVDQACSCGTWETATCFTKLWHERLHRLWCSDGLRRRTWDLAHNAASLAPHLREIPLVVVFEEFCLLFLVGRETLIYEVNMPLCQHRRIWVVEFGEERVELLAADVRGLLVWLVTVLSRAVLFVPCLHINARHAPEIVNLEPPCSFRMLLLWIEASSNCFLFLYEFLFLRICNPLHHYTVSRWNSTARLFIFSLVFQIGRDVSSGTTRGRRECIVNIVSTSIFLLAELNLKLHIRRNACSPV